RCFFFQAEDGIRDFHVTGVQTCALPIFRALIRRAAGHASSELFCGPLRLDTATSKADVDGVPLKLTSHEYRMLAYLMHHKGAVRSEERRVGKEWRAERSSRLRIVLVPYS